MTPIKKDIVELVMTNPHELYINDVKELLADRYSKGEITNAVLSLHLDDGIVGVALNWTLYIYNKPPPYAGEG